MEGDDVVQLVRELAGRLHGVATDLGAGADRIAAFTGQAGEGVAERTGAVDLLARCRLLREQRRRRNAYFPGELFHEPAWDMLLTLYIARVERRTMHVKALVMAADAPVTTSQRWIDQLVRLALAIRAEDPVDRRRVEITLSDAAADAVENYLTEMG